MIEQKGTFLGRPLAQTAQAIQMWEKVLSSLSFSRFVELGTGRGNMSLFFWLWCIEREATFYSWDHAQRWEKDGIFEMLRFDLAFTCGDIFKQSGEIVSRLQCPGQTILFCDNGNKTKEVRRFAPHLKPGDLLAVHDWETECKGKDLVTVLQDFDVYKEEWWDGKTAFFIKNDNTTADHPCNQNISETAPVDPAA